eukprot:TRINITY_DN7383_c0_g2_i1.p1 TRINITY_DN7383_c0_g2~~TRINITY_DN7383_c0_g2_i1.p1  ORF type:complete len:974 (-),score=247.29 TRINITY_DN7383_c0_g2_i1:519-3440(-)
MSKYLTEAVQAVAAGVQENKFKMADIPSVVQICTALHRTYRDFTPELVTLLRNTLEVTSILEEIVSQPGATADKGFLRLRIGFRLLGELFVAGLFPDPTVLHQTIAHTIHHHQVKRAGVPYVVGLITVMNVFVKYFGQEFLDIIPVAPDKKEEGKEEDGAFVRRPYTGAQRSEGIDDRIVSPQHQADFRQLIAGEFFGLAVDTLESLYKDMAEVRAENEKMIGQRGDLTEEQRTLFEKKKKNLEKYFTQASSFAELVEKKDLIPPMPEVTVTPNTNNQNLYFTSYSTLTNTEEVVDFPAHPFNDEEERAFYEDLPTLDHVIPTQTGKRKDDKVEEEPAEESKPEAAPQEVNKELDKEKRAAQSQADAAILDEMLARLPTVCSLDGIDKWVEEFCKYSFECPTRNPKLCRKKLAKALFNVPRTMLELLPFYSRVIAALTVYFKDFGPNMLILFEEEFNVKFTEKNQIHIESKIRNVRFIAELTKFRICSESTTLRLLSKLLDDFSHHNIDVACHLLEGCGRYLYRTSASHGRLNNLLQQMMRLRSVRHFDQRYETMIENAYYVSKPPEQRRGTMKIRQYTPLQQYIRHLIYETLNKATAKKVLKQLRKLDWDNPETMPFVVSTLRKVQHTKYASIQFVASITSALSQYYEDVGVRVVDSLLEDIRSGLETTEAEYSFQQRLLDLKFFGELYIYRVFDTSLVFDVLYMLLFHASYNDAPFDVFRVRMVVSLLETTADYFLDSPSSRKRLLRFMPYFYRYLLLKQKPLPVDLDYKIAETLDHIKNKLLPPADAKNPLMQFPDTIEQATQTIVDLEAKLLSVSKSGDGHRSAAVLSYLYTMVYGAGPSNPLRAAQPQLSQSQSPPPQSPQQQQQGGGTPPLGPVTKPPFLDAANSPFTFENPGKIWPIALTADGEEDAEEEEEDLEQRGGWTMRSFITPGQSSPVERMYTARKAVGKSLKLMWSLRYPLCSRVTLPK